METSAIDGGVRAALKSMLEDSLSEAIVDAATKKDWDGRATIFADKDKVNCN